MATIDDKDIIKNLLLSDGHFEDDPSATSIWSYMNSWKKETQAVFWRGENDILSSPFVHEPKLLWKKFHGVTIEGEEWLKKNFGIDYSEVRKAAEARKERRVPRR